MGIEFGVLGETRARVDGRGIDLGPARQRCVLAALLADANQAVPLDQLADRVWGADPPHRVAVTLRSYVSRLRALLPVVEGFGLRSQSGGYLLEVDEAAVDLHRFRDLLLRARGSADADAATLYELALGQWRGEALADLETSWAVAMRDVLEAERFAARLDYHDVRLRQGQHAGLLGDLAALAAAHPLDERLARQQMLALYRSGRQADALLQYERIRQLLAEELGTYPSSGLQQLHQQILTADPALDPQPTRSAGSATAGAVATPRQLPSDIHGFIGRADSIACLDAFMDTITGREESGPIVISAIDGTAGIGKTALAVHWAHQVKHHFPDGQLYLNLRGYGPGDPVDPTDALGTMLRSLGLDSDRIPTGLDERSALLRSLLASRRVLVLLDNARDSTQVRPLLPGSDALVLITSRRKLRALSARDGARHITLDLLPVPDALDLLAEAIGTDRINREPREAAAITELCARLPLALRLAAERISRRPTDSLRGFVAELADQRNRLAMLSIDEGPDTDLRSVFAWSYDALSPRAAAMFDLLGCHPGNDISMPAVAALVGITPSQAATALEQLTNASMLEQRFPGRYELHDLLRRYARDQAEQHHADQQAAFIRLFGWFVHTAVNAREQLIRSAHRMPVAASPPQGVAPAQFTNYRDAVDWFDLERDNIVKIIQSAGDHDNHETGIILSQLSWPYFYLRGHWQQMAAAGESSLRYAIAIENEFLEGKCLNGLAAAYRRLRGYEEEVAASRKALAIFTRLGDLMEQATSLLNIGAAYNKAGCFAEGRETLERARDLYRKVDNPFHEAMALTNLASSFKGLDRFDEALDCARRATDTFREESDEMRLAYGLEAIASSHAARGDHQEAIRFYRDALPVAEHAQATDIGIQIRVELGRQLTAIGNHQDATIIWQEAYKICIAEGNHAATEIERLLDRRERR